MSSFKIIAIVLFSIGIIAGSVAIIIMSYVRQDEDCRDRGKLGSWQRRFDGEGYDFFDA